MHSKFVPVSRPVEGVERYFGAVECLRSMTGNDVMCNSSRAIAIRSTMWGLSIMDASLREGKSNPHYLADGKEAVT